MEGRVEAAVVVVAVAGGGGDVGRGGDGCGGGGVWRSFGGGFGKALVDLAIVVVVVVVVDASLVSRADLRVRYDPPSRGQQGVVGLAHPQLDGLRTPWIEGGREQG